MQIKCEYCGAYFSDTAEQCPSCGAPNNQIKRAASNIPQTIAEMLQFAQEKNIPLEDIRFFIGVDIREPRAYGIYKDEMTGNFIVYKNKSDGTRAIRYEGKDEAYAVNEIYQKLREEINDNNERIKKAPYTNAPYTNPKDRYVNDEEYQRIIQNNRRKKKLLYIGMVLLVILLLMFFASISPSGSKGGSNRMPNGSDYNYTYDYDSDDSDDSYHTYTYDNDDDDWDTDWDTGNSFDTDWDSFDSDWDSDW